MVGPDELDASRENRIYLNHGVATVGVGMWLDSRSVGTLRTRVGLVMIRSWNMERRKALDTLCRPLSLWFSLSPSLALSPSVAIGPTVAACISNLGIEA